MLGLLRKLAGKPPPPAATPEAPRPPAAVSFPGRPPFELHPHMDVENGFPYMRWAECFRWVDAFPEAERAAAFEAVADAWDHHVCAALGPGYRIARHPGVVLISTLEPRQAQAALEFMQKVQQRIRRTLDGIAQDKIAGNELLIVVDDEETYYRFIARFYPDGGEYSFSSGVQVSDGTVYYVCLKGHLREVEAVIAHEMTHGFVSHLPLPLWLNEGLAVNTERRVAGSGGTLHTPAQMRKRHLEFWGPGEVQEFWSGRSFRRQDDGNELSYDLARILVEHLSADWPRFAAFACAARYDDAGAAAAREHLGIELGAAVAALLEAGDAGPFIPQPEQWREAAQWTPEPA